MSLLQELIEDTRYLLNTTGATREQLDEFTRVSGIDLGEILYSQSKHNIFMEWLHFSKEVNQKALFLYIAMVEYLEDKEEKQEAFTSGEKINCYAYDKTENKYYLCENEKGYCFIYAFDNLKHLFEELKYNLRLNCN